MSSTTIDIPFSSGNKETLKLSIRKLVIQNDGEDVYEVAINNNDNKIATFPSKEGTEYFTMNYVSNLERLKLLNCVDTNELIELMRKLGFNGNIMAAYVAQKAGVAFDLDVDELMRKLGFNGNIMAAYVAQGVAFALDGDDMEGIYSLNHNSRDSDSYLIGGTARAFFHGKGDLTNSYTAIQSPITDMSSTIVDILFSSGSGETIQLNIKEVGYEQREGIYWVAIVQPEEYGRQLTIKITEAALLKLKDIDTNKLIEILKEWGRKGAESIGNRMAAYVAQKTNVPFVPSSSISALYRSLSSPRPTPMLTPTLITTPISTRAPIPTPTTAPIPALTSIPSLDLFWSPTPAPAPTPRPLAKMEVKIPFRKDSDQHITLIIKGYDSGTSWLNVAGHKGYILLSSAELVDFLDGVKNVDNLLKKLENYHSNINPTDKIVNFIRQKISGLNKSYRRTLEYRSMAPTSASPLAGVPILTRKREIQIPFPEGGDQYITLTVTRESGPYYSLRVSGYSGEYLLLSLEELSDFDAAKDIVGLLEVLKKYGAGGIGRFIIQKITNLNKESPILSKDRLMDWYGSVVLMPGSEPSSTPRPTLAADGHSSIWQSGCSFVGSLMRLNNPTVLDPTLRPIPRKGT